MARAARRVLAEVGVDPRCAALAADLKLLACPTHGLRRCPSSAWRSTAP